MEIILFVVGFALLIKGADWLVDGSISVAKRYGISDMVVGLTIVSFGTSLPELIVNLYASFNGNSDLAVGNIFGSNIANVLLILGFAAIICPLPIKKNTVLSEIPFSMIAALLTGYLANVSLFPDDIPSTLSRIDGIIILFFFLLFLAYIAHLSKEKGDIDSVTDEIREFWHSIFFIFIGIICLYFGGDWVVKGAVFLGNYFGLSEAFIGLTIVAIGTSLPELVTSAVAAYKKNIDIAVGNVVGSNIFNILWILGLSAIINPISFNTINNYDILVIVFTSTLIIASMAFNKDRSVSRISGIVYILLYILYIYFIYQRG